jgi:hypothetical protein
VAVQTDQLNCAKHNVTLIEGERCRQCTAEKRVSAITVVAQAQGLTAVESAEIDAEILKDCEADITYAKFLHRVSRERIEDGNPNDWRAAAALIAEGTKLKYRALEMKEKVSAKAHSRYLVEHEKDIKGLRRKGN